MAVIEYISRKPYISHTKKDPKKAHKNDISRDGLIGRAVDEVLDSHMMGRLLEYVLVCMSGNR